MKDLNVMFTMDCEAIDALAAEGGPKDWDLAKRAMFGFCEMLLNQGFKATLFIVPVTAEKLRKEILELETQGIEAALHYHPQDYGHKDYLGAYDGIRQMAMLNEAKKRWSYALGKSPKSFRGGNFSANDYTYPVLEQLGFKQGSLSVSGRNFTRVKSNWKGSPLFPYRTNAANRLLEGEMDFLEVPVTCDWESIMWGGLTPLELRVEMVDARSHGYTIRKNVELQIKQKHVQPALVVLTHNIFDYSDRSEFRTNVLEGIVEQIRLCAQTHALDIKGPTLGEYRKCYDEAFL